MLQDDLIFTPKVLGPAEAAAMREATVTAIKLIGPPKLSEPQKKLVAEDVMRIARSGYARSIDGALDATALAEAAAPRFRSFDAGH